MINSSRRIIGYLYALFMRYILSGKTFRRLKEILQNY